MNFTVGGIHPVSTDYIADVIAHIGLERFRELNPWIDDLIKIKKKTKPKLTQREYDWKMTQAHALKEFDIDMKEKGWTQKQCAQFHVSEKKLTRRLAADRKKVGAGDKSKPFDILRRSENPALDRLNSMFKYPRRRSQGKQYGG